MLSLDTLFGGVLGGGASLPLLEVGALGLQSPAWGLGVGEVLLPAFSVLSLALALPASPLGVEMGAVAWLTFEATAAASASNVGLLADARIFASLAVVAQRVTVTLQPHLELLEAADLGLLVVELALVGALIRGATTVLNAHASSAGGYADLITWCQGRAISVAEVFTSLSFFVGFILFDAFVTLAEDDVLEAVSYVFACIIILAVLLLVLAVDVQYYYMVASVSGGEPTLRTLYNDIVNNGLCLLRVFFCWVRYLFYDLQAELVDIPFHYTEAAEAGWVAAPLSLGGELGSGLGWGLLAALGWGTALTLVEAGVILVQLLIGAFKLALALFLFWLIVDLFLLRTLARTEARWSMLQARRG